MRTDALDEPTIARWLTTLNTAERLRAERFAFPKHRAQFVAAHTLTRVMLAKLTGKPADQLRFTIGDHGKPTVCIDAASEAPSFNLSRTDGLVGVAAANGHNCAIGFDLEPINRNVSLSIASRYFRSDEIAWLESLPRSERKTGFLRLWTLKEAFIKATGTGLAQDLAEFWFDLTPLHIHFAPSLQERTEDWWFQQRIVDANFVAALGVRRTGGSPIATSWTMKDPLELL
jgi:4'-phosphopantetheinyl transferase